MEAIRVLVSKFINKFGELIEKKKNSIILNEQKDIKNGCCGKKK